MGFYLGLFQSRTLSDTTHRDLFLNPFIIGALQKRVIGQMKWVEYRWECPLSIPSLKFYTV